MISYLHSHSESIVSSLLIIQMLGKLDESCIAFRFHDEVIMFVGLLGLSRHQFKEEFFLLGNVRTKIKNTLI